MFANRSSNTIISNNSNNEIFSSYTSNSKLKCKEFNNILTCPICNGYLIQPTKINNCLHTFCRTCIVMRLMQLLDKCPCCDDKYQYTNLRADTTLRSVIYKLVPGLYKREQKRFHKFLEERNLNSASLAEGYGLFFEEGEFFSPDDPISLSLEYNPHHSHGIKSRHNCDNEIIEQCDTKIASTKLFPKIRYLQCPAAATVRHLQRFLSYKFNLDHKNNIEIDIIHQDEILPVGFTLMDAAYCYNWKRLEPMRFYYQIFIRNSTINSSKMHAEAKQINNEIANILFHGNDNYSSNNNRTICTDSTSVAVKKESNEINFIYDTLSTNEKEIHKDIDDSNDVYINKNEISKIKFVNDDGIINNEQSGIYSFKKPIINTALQTNSNQNKVLTQIYVKPKSDFKNLRSNDVKYINHNDNLISNILGSNNNDAINRSSTGDAREINSYEYSDDKNNLPKYISIKYNSKDNAQEIETKPLLNETNSLPLVYVNPNSNESGLSSPNSISNGNEDGKHGGKKRSGKMEALVDNLKTPTLDANVVVSIPPLMHRQTSFDNLENLSLGGLKTANSKKSKRIVTFNPCVQSKSTNCTTTNVPNNLSLVNSLIDTPKLKMELNSLKAKISIDNTDSCIEHSISKDFEYMHPSHQKIDVTEYAKNIGLTPIARNSPEDFTPKNTNIASTNSSSMEPLVIAYHKKRKKSSKRSKEIGGKRPKLHAEISSNQEGKESLKLKVKITGSKNSKYSFQNSNCLRSEDTLSPLYPVKKSTSFDNSTLKSDLNADRVKLLEMRQVRHKSIPPLPKYTNLSHEERSKSPAKTKSFKIVQWDPIKNKKNSYDSMDKNKESTNILPQLPKGPTSNSTICSQSSNRKSVELKQSNDHIMDINPFKYPSLPKSQNYSLSIPLLKYSISKTPLNNFSDTHNKCLKRTNSDARSIISKVPKLCSNTSAPHLVKSQNNLNHKTPTNQAQKLFSPSESFYNSTMSASYTHEIPAKGTIPLMLPPCSISVTKTTDVTSNNILSDQTHEFPSRPAIEIVPIQSNIPTLDQQHLRNQQRKMSQSMPIPTLESTLLSSRLNKSTVKPSRPPPATIPLIKIRNIQKAYSGKSPVTSSSNIKKGDIMALDLSGKTGKGKEPRSFFPPNIRSREYTSTSISSKEQQSKSSNPNKYSTAYITDRSLDKTDDEENLKMLSESAVAREKLNTKSPPALLPANKLSSLTMKSKTDACSSGSLLYLNKQLPNPILTSYRTHPPIPKLNEISKIRHSLIVNRQQQNASIRNIPNPSALASRCQPIQNISKNPNAFHSLDDSGKISVKSTSTVNSVNPLVTQEPIVPNLNKDISFPNINPISSITDDKDINKFKSSNFSAIPLSLSSHSNNKNLIKTQPNITTYNEIPTRKIKDSNAHKVIESTKHSEYKNHSVCQSIQKSGQKLMDANKDADKSVCLNLPSSAENSLKINSTKKNVNIERVAATLRTAVSSPHDKKLESGSNSAVSMQSTLSSVYDYI